MIIEINNWSVYNPKRAQKTYTWLRLNNDFFSSEDLFKLKLEQKAIYAALLCQASEKNSSEFDLDLDWFAHHIGCTAALITTSIEVLEKKGLLSVLHDTTPDDTELHDPTPTNETGRDGTDGRTDHDPEIVLTPQKLMDHWNKNRDTLPECTILSDPRIKKAKAQIKKYPKSSHWSQALSGFKVVDFGWRPSFDDWLSESKRVKAFEGGYSGTKNASKSFSEKGIEHRISQRDRILGGENELKDIN